MSRHLQSEGYNVVLATGSMAALQELEKGGIDIAVIDVALQPGEPHGISLAKMLAFNVRPVPILLVTGRKDLIDIAGTLPGEVLYKPIELNQLAQKVGLLRVCLDREG
jgi:DNA-binding response OmpR family regulator